MKIRFLKTISADVETPTGEISDRCFYKWQELQVLEIFETSGLASIRISDKEFAINVPLNSFEQIKEEKRTVTF